MGTQDGNGDEPTPLYKSPDQETPSRSGAAMYDDAIGYPHQPMKETVSGATKNVERIYKLHPYVANLSLAAVESCVKLEDAAFPEHERCSREKVRPNVNILEQNIFLYVRVWLEF